MKRIISLTLLFIFLSFAFISCGDDEIPDRSYNESEVISAAKTLIFKSRDLNDIFWGKGIAWSDDTSTSQGYYFMADDISLKSYGVENVSDIERITRETFSEFESNRIFSTVFSSISDSTGIQYMARYSQKYADDGVTPEYILVYTKYPIIFVDTVDYDYESLRVSGVKGNTVYVDIDCTVTNPEGKSQKRTLTVSLVEESSGWRIDSPTYCAYSE